MDVEERTKKAITVTRQILFGIFDDPFALAFMTFYEVEPDELEDKVTQILEYLEMSAEEAEGHE